MGLVETETLEIAEATARLYRFIIEKAEDRKQADEYLGYARTLLTASDRMADAIRKTRAA